MNRNVKMNFAFVLVTRRTQPAPPSVESAALSMIPIIAMTTTALMPNGMGCWKATRNSCIVAEMLAEGRAAQRAHPPGHRYDEPRPPGPIHPHRWTDPPL